MKEISERVTIYENRIVCFIDILGFSGIIKSTTSDDKEKAQNTLKNVCEALFFLRECLDSISIHNIKTTQFSDSIVISFPWNKEDWHMLAVFKTIKHIQIVLLYRYNLLLRGGIVIGDVIHTDKLIVGPAMINAYALESKCANSPRIVLDPKVVYRFNILKNNAKKGNFAESDKIIHKDLDDTSYIDYFNVDEDEIFDEEEEKVRYFRKLCQLIADNVGSTDMSIRMKYLWMRNKVKHSEWYKQSKYAAIYKQIVTDKKK
jgi:hypothetical protein